jgi:threonine dehydrogenase-like Zn-dependent dehydrogenase
MKALTVIPLQKDSARLEDVPEPPERDGPILVETLQIGICGTDIDILGGDYGWPPRGEQRLIIGHESLGRVLSAPQETQLVPGDLVVGFVRRPDPIPCSSCAVGEWDMCRNGQYTERGIKERHGYGSERYRIQPEHVVKLAARLATVGVLVEPTSVVAKAWEQIERIGARAHWRPRRALITGAGPIGLLAALLGVQRGYEVHVLDRVTDGPKPRLVAALGATYHHGPAEDASQQMDIIIECTGVGQLVLDALSAASSNRIVCLTGVSSGSRSIPVDVASLNKHMVLENDVVFGSVNANARHYRAAVTALAAADPDWLAQLITRRLPLARWSEALIRQPHDVKAIIQLDS